jgi:hypothetical protein
LDNPDLPEGLWSQLDGRLWHATSRDGLHGIIVDKEIRPAVGERYVGSFCRNQGGVSLFDFGPASEDIPGQFHNWCGWLGHQQGARVAVWLEIDRASVHKRLLDAKTTREALELLMDRRRAEDKTHEPGITIIPGVEACHYGPIPIADVTGVLLIDRHDLNLFRPLGKPEDDIIQEIDAYEASLSVHEENPIVRALLAGRRRAQAKPSDE